MSLCSIWGEKSEAQREGELLEEGQGWDDKTHTPTTKACALNPSTSSIFNGCKGYCYEQRHRAPQAGLESRLRCPQWVFRVFCHSVLLFPHQSCLQPLFCTLRLRHAPLLLAAHLPQGHARTAEQNPRLRAGLPTSSPGVRSAWPHAFHPWPLAVCFCTEHTSPWTGAAPTCPHPTAPPQLEPTYHCTPWPGNEGHLPMDPCVLPRLLPALPGLLLCQLAPRKSVHLCR